MTPNEAKSKFSKFSSLPFRHLQDTAVDHALNSSKKFTIIEAPTGSGKSLVGMCILAGLESGIYAVHSKPLQNQIEDDFPEGVVLFGRDNYPCVRNAMTTAADCTASKTSPCSLKSKCPYKVRKLQAVSSPYPVLNYSYLLTEVNYVGKFSGRPVIVIDEADSLESTLYQFTALSLHSKALDRYQIELPDYKTVSTSNGLANWKAWGSETYSRLNNKLNKLARKIEVLEESGTDEEDLEPYRKDFERLSGLVSKLSIFNEYLDSTWLFDERDDKYGTRYEFRPLWLSPQLTEKFLWSHAAKFVLMSATFPPVEVLGKILGIPYSQIDSISVPSTFDPSRRKVIARPVANLTSKTMEAETPKAINQIKSILAIHSNDKGLVHTVSYKLRDEIMSIDNSRLLTHNARDKIEILEKFRNSEFPLVLISPSSERGISLPGSDCRFIIIVKASYLSLGDKSVKQRIYSSQTGQLWYTSDMALTVVQMAGRGMRSAEDYCTTYILDYQITNVLFNRPGLFPSWFREAIET